MVVGLVLSLCAPVDEATSQTDTSSVARQDQNKKDIKNKAAHIKNIHQF